MNITPTLISILVVGVPAALAGLSMFLNRHFYPKTGMVILKYINNMVDSVRVRETINCKGDDCIEVKWGRFWFPSKSKVIQVDKPAGVKNILNMTRSNFYVLVSNEPGDIGFVGLEPRTEDLKDDPISIEDMDWALHHIEVESETNYETGLSFWKENEAVFLMLIVFFMMVVILSFYSQGVVNTVVDRLTTLTGGTVASGGDSAFAFTGMYPQH